MSALIIVLQEDKTLRLPQKQEIKVDLCDIIIYIPKIYSGYNLFCTISLDDNNIPIPIKYEKEYNNTYDIYKLDLIKVSMNSVCSLMIVGFKTSKDLPVVSDTITIDIDSSKYEIAYSVYVYADLKSELINYYNKISEMTKLNIKIHDEILGGGGQ